MLKKISVVGKGKMGKSVVDLLSEQDYKKDSKKNYKLDKIFDASNPVSKSSLINLDLVIDCSVGEAFLQNLPLYLESKVNLIVVASNWYHQLQEVQQQVLNSGIKFLYSDNYAVGSYIYKQILEATFQKLTGLGFDFALQESHHFYKKDYPSAVAKKIADLAIHNLQEKTSWSADPAIGVANKKTFYISSLRYGANTIEHSLNCASEAEDIKITHSVRNRKVFAQGIVSGIEFLDSQAQGFYDMASLVDWLHSTKSEVD